MRADSINQGALDAERAHRLKPYGFHLDNYTKDV
jgi:hypothetical protein